MIGLMGALRLIGLMGGASLDRGATLNRVDEARVS